MSSKVKAAATRVEKAATSKVKPTDRQVLKAMTSAEKTALANKVAAQRGYDVSTKEGKLKAKNIRRTIERQTTTKEGAQTRGSKKGLSSEYSRALKKEFREKYTPRTEKKFKPIKIQVKARFNFYGSDNRRRAVTFDLDAAQAEAFATAEDEDKAMQVLLASAPNSMEAAEVSAIESMRII